MLLQVTVTDQRSHTITDVFIYLIQRAREYFLISKYSTYHTYYKAHSEIDQEKTNENIFSRYDHDGAIEIDGSRKLSTMDTVGKV